MDEMTALETLLAKSAPAESNGSAMLLKKHEIKTNRTSQLRLQKTRERDEQQKVEKEKRLHALLTAMSGEKAVQNREKSKSDCFFFEARSTKDFSRRHAEVEVPPLPAVPETKLPMHAIESLLSSQKGRIDELEKELSRQRLEHIRMKKTHAEDKCKLVAQMESERLTFSSQSQLFSTQTVQLEESMEMLRAAFDEERRNTMDARKDNDRLNEQLSSAVREINMNTIQRERFGRQYEQMQAILAQLQATAVSRTTPSGDGLKEGMLASMDILQSQQRDFLLGPLFARPSYSRFSQTDLTALNGFRSAVFCEESLSGVSRSTQTSTPSVPSAVSRVSSSRFPQRAESEMDVKLLSAHHDLSQVQRDLLKSEQCNCDLRNQMAEMSQRLVKFEERAHADQKSRGMLEDQLSCAVRERDKIQRRLDDEGAAASLCRNDNELAEVRDQLRQSELKRVEAEQRADDLEHDLRVTNAAMDELRIIAASHEIDSDSERKKEKRQKKSKKEK